MDKRKTILLVNTWEDHLNYAKMLITIVCSTKIHIANAEAAYQRCILGMSIEPNTEDDEDSSKLFDIINELGDDLRSQEQELEVYSRIAVMLPRSERKTWKANP